MKKNSHLSFSIKYLIYIFIVFLVILSIWIFYLVHPYSKDTIKIGSSYMTMNNEFYPIVNEQVANYVEQRNDFLYNRDPALNVNKQVSEIHSFIRKNVNAILINPVDANSPKLNHAIEEAHKKGIKIIIVDSQVKTKQVDCTITSDNYEAGKLCAQELLKNKKAARILLLEHKKAMSGVDRIRGFTKTIKKANNPRFKIVGSLNVNGQAEIAYPMVKRFLLKHQVNTIMALNDRAALGALAAIDAVNPHAKIGVYSVDGSEDMKKMIGVNSHAVLSVAQSPITIGKLAAKEAYRLIKGRKVPKKIVLPVKIINQHNLNQYNLTGWQ